MTRPMVCGVCHECRFETGDKASDCMRGVRRPVGAPRKGYHGAIEPFGCAWFAYWTPDKAGWSYLVRNDDEVKTMKFSMSGLSLTKQDEVIEVEASSGYVRLSISDKHSAEFVDLTPDEAMCLHHLLSDAATLARRVGDE